MAPLIVLGIDGLNLLRLFTNTLDVIEQLAALTPGTQNAALTRKYNSLIGCPSRATKPDQSATVTRRGIVFCVQESPPAPTCSCHNVLAICWADDQR